MKNYLAQDWRDILRHNGLDSFDALWALEAEWFEEPNQRRGGWSGVSRFEMKLPQGGTRAVFLKRQENHVTRSWQNPFGMATFVREMRNILRFKNRGVPALEPVYFAVRRIDGDLRAILVTEELAGYTSLEDLVESWEDHGWPSRQERRRLIDEVAAVVRKMNDQHLQSNCLYPKHVLVKQEDDRISVRIIDLEKAKWQLLKGRARFRDLDTLNRHSKGWGTSDRLRFYLAYWQLPRLTPATKALWRHLARRTDRKNRLRAARARQ